MKRNDKKIYLIAVVAFIAVLAVVLFAVPAVRNAIIDDLTTMVFSLFIIAAFLVFFAVVKYLVSRDKPTVFYVRTERKPEEKPEEAPKEEPVVAVVAEEPATEADVRVRNDYTFTEKLEMSNDFTKGAYEELISFARLYKVKIARSAKKERIYAGRVSLVRLSFRGKKLCVAFALDPAEYNDPKLKVEDMSEVAAFRDTPVMLRLTSDLKVRRAKQLLAAVFAAYGIELLPVPVEGSVEEVPAAEEVIAPAVDIRVRNDYTFTEKLEMATDFTKGAYGEVVSFARRYKVKVARSAKKERVYIGRVQLARIGFRGKTLCVAFALDPAQYNDPKLKVEDMSEVSAYRDTPVMIRLTSDRKVRRAKQLLAAVFGEKGVELLPVPVEEPVEEPVEAPVEEVVTPVEEVAVPVEEVAEPVEEVAVPVEEAAEAPIEEVVAAEVPAFGGSGPRYSFSFAARLALATDLTRKAYSEIVSFAREYKVKIARSAKKERIYIGRVQLARISFRGKRLCVAFALDPAAYSDPKLKVEDMSEVSAFRETPVMLRISSERKIKRAKQLLAAVFEEKGIVPATRPSAPVEIENKTFEELVEAGEIKVK